jgi:predicted enzyme related to lactoylglutathione lyase
MAAKSKDGSIVHVEITSKSPPKTKAFFAEVFGWKFTEMPEMGYATFEPAAKPAGGMMKSGKGMPVGVTNYLLATSIDKTLGKVTKAGGKVVRPKTEIPGVGWFAVIQTPGEVVFALFQPK